MFCFVAFAVLVVMGVFSATHRALAHEAFDCMTKRVTLQPCDTGFQEKVRASLVGSLLQRSVWAARFVNKHYELLAWVVFALTVWSLFATGQGLYNFYFYGSCSGLNATSFCVLDPAGNNNAVSGVDVPEDVLLPECGGNTKGEGTLNPVPIDRTLYPRQDNNSVNELMFIGCFECQYTRKTYPIIQRLREEHDINYTFVHYPTKQSTAYLTAVTQCVYQENPGHWTAFIDTLFTSETAQLADSSYVYTLLDEMGFDSTVIRDCAQSSEMEELVETMRQQVVGTGIYGTPLIFVNDQPIVGPKPYRVYRFMLE